jgi:MFS family permease
MKDESQLQAGRRRLEALRLPGFGRIAGAYLVNELGNWLGEIALAILVFEQTGSPVAVAALFLAMQFVPAIATPPLIARLDPLGSRSALALLYVAEAAAFCLLALLATDDTFLLAAVLVIAAFDGTLATAARARTRATAGTILEPHDLLREGNGILNVGFTAGAAVGPALAGVVVAGAGAQAALLADAGSFLIVGAMLATSRALPSGASEDADGWLERLRRGFSYVGRRPALRGLMAAEGVAFVFFALVLPIEVAFAKETLDAGDVGYGLLLAAWGTGMVVGSLLFSWLRQASLPALLVAGTLAIGVAYVGTAAAPTLAVACLASIVGGAGNGIQWVAVVTAVQGLTEQAYQARVIGLLESLASGLSGAGFLLGGAIAALLTPRASYAVAGIGVLAVLTVAVLALRGTRWQREADGLAPSQV